MRKTPLILLSVLCLLQAATCNICFGEECKHISVDVAEPVDPVRLTTLIEQEVKRQYWYYLRDANLLYQANLNLPGRLIIFYFHRNIVGTFFTIASYNFEGGFSELNTLVRLGNGYSTNVQTNYDPVSIDPFIITMNLGEGEVQIELADDGTLTIDGQVIDLTNNPQVDPTEEEARCIALSDAYLRRTYWYYLNRAALISQEGLATNVRVYALLTYTNIVGTFLVITSCEEEIVKANTFVRLGEGFAQAQDIVVDPIILSFDN